MRPALYWISGSPPAWRVMLALTLKGVAFDSRRLEHARSENKSASYLALNPKGQVPTLTCGDLVIRESIAILAWLDRAFPERPIWGDGVKDAARVWQDVMVMETDLRPLIAPIAQALIGKRAVPAERVEGLGSEMDAWSARLARAPFLGGDTPMASDIWLYPALHWVARGVQLSQEPPELIARLFDDRPPLAAWSARLAALPGVAGVHPPHWRKN